MLVRYKEVVLLIFMIPVFATLMFNIRPIMYLYGIETLALIIYGMSSAGIIMDKETSTITQWWGIFKPMKQRIVDFNDVTAVTIGKAHAPHLVISMYVFPIYLECDGKPLRIEEPKTYKLARKRSEELSKFLDVKIIDRTLSTELEVEPGMLDLSIREKWNLRPGKYVVPDVPENCRIVSSVEGDTLTCTIPAAGYRKCLGLLALHIVILVGIMGTCLALSHLLPWIVPDNPELMFILFGLLLLAAIGFRFIHDSNYFEEISIDSYSLKFKYASLIGPKTREVRLDEIKELIVAEQSLPDFMPGTIVTARTDNEVLEFGRRINKDELEFLHGLVLGMIIQPK